MKDHIPIAIAILFLLLIIRMAPGATGGWGTLPEFEPNYQQVDYQAEIADYA